MQTLTRTTHSAFLLTAGPLLLVLFIDGMGLGLIIPVLNALLAPTNHFLGSGLSVKLSNFIFGSVIGIFMLCWFFGAAILGDLSDQIGRKKSLLICLIGAFLGYLLAAIAVIIHSLALLLLGRIIAGLTSGSQPIAQAAIIDLSLPAHKTRNIGFILTALSLGFILGPLLGGLLSDHRVISWFNLATPFYFAALLSLLNAALLGLLFHETFVRKTALNLNIKRAWYIFTSAFQQAHIRNLSIIFLIFISGWNIFYFFITLYLTATYAFTAAEISFFMAIMGLGFSIGNGIFVEFFAKRFTPTTNVRGAVLISAGCTLIMVCTHQVYYVWLLVAPLAAAVAVAYSNILVLFSNQVTAAEQGWVMGITGAIMAAACGVVAILGGVLATVSAQLPLLLAALGFVAAAGLTYGFKNKTKAVMKPN